MFKIEEREYQKNIIDELFDSLNSKQKILVQLATGGGKTIIFSIAINKIIKDHKSKVIILCHRDELVQQAIDSLNYFGIICCPITANTKTVSNDFKVYVSMVETLHNRFKKDKNFITGISHVFIDECHIGSFDKIIDIFYDKKIIGFTATPLRNKRRSFFKCEYCGEKSEESKVCCFSEKMEKYSQPVTMSEVYDDIVVGPEIKTLINQGALVDELVFTYNFYDNLEAKGNDEFDENEIAEESIKHDQNVLEEYLDKAKGKKTMIFTASTKQNISLLETFKDFQVRSYDTVNENEYNRKEVVDWFRATEGAILISTGTFTTGFDVKEVECIIVNRPIQSLSLWLQIVGRGARPTNSFYKDTFILIDLGGNVKRLGKWSDPIDWKSIFFKGLKPEKRTKPKLIQCDACGYNFVGFGGEPCEDCGHINIPVVMEKSLGTGRENDFERVLTKTSRVSVIPIPNGRKIAEFVKRTTNSKNDYWRIIIEKYIDLWKYNNVSRTIYFQRAQSGKLEQRIMEYLKMNYGYVNILSEGVPRTYEYLLNKIKKGLEKLYKDT